MLLSTLWKKEKSFFQSRLRIHSRCSYELGGWEKVYYYILEQIEDDQFPDCQFFSWCMRKPEYKKGLHNFNLHESSKNAHVVVDVLHERCDQRVETIRHNFRSRHTASASFLSFFSASTFHQEKQKFNHSRKLCKSIPSCVIHLKAKPSTKITFLDSHFTDSIFCPTGSALFHQN